MERAPTRPCGPPRRLRTLETPDPSLGAFADAETSRGALAQERLAEALLEAIDDPPERLARRVFAAARICAGGRRADDFVIAMVKRTA